MKSAIEAWKSQRQIQPRGSAGLLLLQLPAHLRASEVPPASVISRNRPRGRIRVRAGWIAARVRDNKVEYTRSKTSHGDAT